MLSIFRREPLLIRAEDFSQNRETNDLIVEVFRLNGLLIATADRLVAKFGITGARWQVMGALVQAGGAETVSGLARAMGLTRQSVQRVVNDMVAGGQLMFETNPQHKRAKLVRLTLAGEKTFTAALKIQIPWVQELSDGLTKQQLIDAKQVLETLRHRLLGKGAD